MEWLEQSRVIFTTDKGVTWVVLDKEDYIRKVEELLGEQNTYKRIPTDHITKQKNKLISLLKDIKAKWG